MPTTPGDKVQRQDQSEAGLNDIPFMEDEPMAPGYAQLRVVHTDQIVIERWRVKVALSYLVFTSILCLTAILIEPSSEVRLVVLAVWGSTSAAGGALLRWGYRRP
ncbi:hypothetical protein [Geodermatophilus sp. SYSU D00696]